MPGGTVRIDDPFHIKRPADDRLIEAVKNNGETIVIKAPRQMGKSSLPIRYLAACQEVGKAIVYIDFQSVTNADLDIYGVLLQCLTRRMLQSLRINDNSNLWSFAEKAK